MALRGEEACLWSRPYLKRLPYPISLRTLVYTTTRLHDSELHAPRKLFGMSHPIYLFMPSLYYIPYTPLFYYLALHLVVFAITRNLAVFFSLRVVYHVAGLSLTPPFSSILLRSSLSCLHSPVTDATCAVYALAACRTHLARITTFNFLFLLFYFIPNPQIQLSLSALQCILSEHSCFASERFSARFCVGVVAAGVV